MTTALRILLVEDNPDDELIVTRELRRAGLTTTTERVESREAFHAALDASGWDLIISDYNLPGFGGLEALAIRNRSSPATPFILISGTVGEDVAVESIKAGADDYLLKSSLIRLVPAVNRVIQDARTRREHLAAERALRESQQRLELIFQTVSDFMVFFTADAEGHWHFTSANRAFAAILTRVGFTLDPAQLVGREADEVAEAVFGLDPTTRDWLRDQRDRAVRTRRPLTSERTMTLPGGTFVGEFTHIPIFDADGQCRHLLCDGRDVTDLRRAEEQERAARDQLLQSQKLEALGTLAGGVAHDFNNMLTGILGFAELAVRADTLPTAQQMCREILQAAERSRELVNNILTFAQHQPADRYPLVLTDIAREVAPLLRASFSKGIEVIEELPDRGPLVVANSGQLHQVILNLGTNAAQAMPSGGCLRIGVRAVELAEPIPADLRPLSAGAYGVITVADNGTGMSAETLRRIFEPFFTTKSSSRGTGLGLSIVHGIIRDHRGVVRVRSELGQGSTFEVFLPQVADALAPAPRTTCPTKPPSARVLYLDDEPVLAVVARRMLASLGYRATSFTDPKEAYAAFAADPDSFHIVLTDNRMPGWSGIEFIRRVRAIRSDIPVVLVSGAVEPDDLEFAGSAGRGTRLDKPFTVEQLGGTVAAALAAVGPPSGR